MCTVQASTELAKLIARKPALGDLGEDLKEKVLRSANKVFSQKVTPQDFNMFVRCMVEGAVSECLPSVYSVCKIDGTSTEEKEDILRLSTYPERTISLILAREE